MAESFENITKLLNRIASNLPCLDKSDLSILASVMGDLESITQHPTPSPAFKTLVTRAASLAQHMIMDETDFDNGCKKLGESVGKLLNSVGSSTGKKERKEEREEHGEREESRDGPDNNTDVKDLLVKFAANQQPVLEDFEAYILEMEKDNPGAPGALKRIMHTWKGEFGVLGLQDYSRLMHTIEDDFETGTLTTDVLFKLKDVLADKFSQFSAGKSPALVQAEWEALHSSALGTKVIKTTAREEIQPPVVPAEKPVSVPAPEVVPVSGENAFSGDPSLMGDFVTESRDHIHTAETLLLELETDPTHSESIDSIFRAWHTIKGVAGFLSLKQINSLAHTMESLMDRVRKKEIVLNPALIDLLLESNDCLKEFIELVERAMSGAPLTIPENYSIVLEKLTSPVVGMNTSISSAPVNKKMGEILVASGAATTQNIEAALKKQQEGDERKLGVILIEENKVPVRQVASALAAQQSTKQASAIEETIRMPVARIGQLIDTIGEAVIAQSMIYATPAIKNLQDQTIHTKFAHAGMIMRQIQEMAMSLRMVSIKSTFQKMARLARDLGKKFNKDIDFLTEGEDTELDKSVVENIGDPLIHMIRNSIDHGIESNEERIKVGKSTKSMIKLRAFHRAGSIFIEVIDDGKGLDKDAIYQKALSKDLCKTTDHLSDQEIFQFIFLPGFSTAKQVTDVSGRGVGMDVVRRNIEALRGSVEISSEPGKGTTFTIRLPLTLAIVDGMIIRAGDDSYIIPTLAIVESLRPEAKDIDTVMHKGRIVKVRGELIPMVHLASIFGHNGAAWDATSGVVMIVEDMLGKKLGLHVDEIIGQQQVVIKSLGDGVGDIPGVTGGAIMSDGNVSLILDIGGILKMSEG